jgi:transcriptional regulator with XRE-family HTH domain
MTVKELASRGMTCESIGMPGMKSIGSAIREARIAKRLSLADVASAVGFDLSSVSRIELGRPTTSRALERVAAAVGLEIVARRARKVTG